MRYNTLIFHPTVDKLVDTDRDFDKDKEKFCIQYNIIKEYNHTDVIDKNEWKIPEKICPSILQLEFKIYSLDIFNILDKDNNNDNKNGRYYQKENSRHKVLTLLNKEKLKNM